MLKITASEIAILINRSPKYVYQLLTRKKLKLVQMNLEELIELVCLYRWQRWELRKGIKRIYRKGMSARVVLRKFDALFKDVYRECKDSYEGKCAKCGNEGEVVHHIDIDHGNMDLSNLMFLCSNCHREEHKGFVGSGKFKLGIYNKRENLR